jgi:TctA family transporter
VSNGESGKTEVQLLTQLTAHGTGGLGDCLALRNIASATSAFLLHFQSFNQHLLMIVGPLIVPEMCCKHQFKAFETLELNLGSTYVEWEG